MSNPEEILGDNDFDAEVGRLFDELANSQESVSERQEREGLEEIHANLLDKLPLYGVENIVVAKDIERQDLLSTDYLTKLRHKILYDLQFSPQGVAESDYPRIASDVMIAYYEEREYQSIVAFSAAKIANAYINNLEDEKNRYEYHGTKKALQADFMVHYGRRGDDPMMVFFATETPGANLDVTNPEDKGYIDMAHAKHDKFKQDRARKYQVITVAKDLLGLDDESCSEEKIAYSTQVLIEMVLTASSTNLERASDRTAQLTETARLLKRSNIMTNAIVALVEAHYPTG